MNTSDGMLRQIVSRIENLETEKATLAEDIKNVYAEAKSNGFCVKTLRKIVSIRKKEDHTRAEEEAILATYMLALGMIGQLADTPLGNAALPKDPRIAQDASKEEASTIHARRLENARQQGWEAGREGKKDTDNPYTSEDACFSAWEEARGSIVPARVAA